jgi:hydrogenase maturation protease
VSGTDPTVDVTVRFLHVVRRQVYRGRDRTTREPVDELQVGTQRYSSWEEATERTVTIDHLSMGTDSWHQQIPVLIPEQVSEECLTGSDGAPVGTIVRHWHELRGVIELSRMPVDTGCAKLRVRVANTTPWHEGSRDRTLLQTFVSTHTVLSVQSGRFVSLIDPPEAYIQAAGECQNIGTWPVLAGDPQADDQLLSSPIILYDYPRVAPESPGDLFDGTEIDQLLTLNILALSDEDKAEMRATDHRARVILERTESLTVRQFMRLHGTLREREVWEELEQPPPRQVSIGEADIKIGSRVRLRPKPGGDVWDIALAGQTGSVEAIEQDFEERVYVAVSLDVDPGRDLSGISPGHRFFFSLDELEVIPDASIV